MNGGHGHVRPRTDGAVARCGGPEICAICQMEQTDARTPGSAAARIAELVDKPCPRCNGQRPRAVGESYCTPCRNAYAHQRRRAHKAVA